MSANVDYVSSNGSEIANLEDFLRLPSDCVVEVANYLPLLKDVFNFISSCRQCYRDLHENGHFWEDRLVIVLQQKGVNPREAELFDPRRSLLATSARVGAIYFKNQVIRNCFCFTIKELIDFERFREFSSVPVSSAAVVEVDHSITNRYDGVTRDSFNVLENCETLYFLSSKLRNENGGLDITNPNLSNLVISVDSLKFGALHVTSSGDRRLLGPIINFDNSGLENLKRVYVVPNYSYFKNDSRNLDLHLPVRLIDSLRSLLVTPDGSNPTVLSKRIERVYFLHFSDDFSLHGVGPERLSQMINQAGFEDTQNLFRVKEIEIDEERNIVNVTFNVFLDGNEDPSYEKSIEIVFDNILNPILVVDPIIRKASEMYLEAPENNDLEGNAPFAE